MAQMNPVVTGVVIWLLASPCISWGYLGVHSIPRHDFYLIFKLVIIKSI